MKKYKKIVLWVVSIILFTLVGYYLLALYLVSRLDGTGKGKWLPFSIQDKTTVISVTV